MGDEVSVDKRRLESLASFLAHCQLNSLEKHFLERVKEYFEEHGQLTDQQESILKGIYREKVRWTKERPTRPNLYC